MDSSFRDGVIERYGHCSDGLVGLVRLIAGAGKREPWEDDYSPTASSLVTHVAQCVVFGAVMADAAMLEARSMQCSSLMCGLGSQVRTAGEGKWRVYWCVCPSIVLCLASCVRFGGD